VRSITRDYASSNNLLVSNDFPSQLPGRRASIALVTLAYIYCNQTLIGNRLLRAFEDKTLPSGRTHIKITQYARNSQTHARCLRGANQSVSPTTWKFHSLACQNPEYSHD